MENRKDNSWKPNIQVTEVPGRVKEKRKQTKKEKKKNYYQKPSQNRRTQALGLTEPLRSRNQERERRLLLSKLLYCGYIIYIRYLTESLKMS